MRKTTKLPWLVLVLTACGGSTQTTWPKFHRDSPQTGRSQFATSANTGTQKWKLATAGVVRSSPAIADDGTIYVGSADGNLYALKPDGTVKWKFATGGPVNSSPALSGDGTIHVGSGDGNLYAVNPDGSLWWKFTVGGGPVESSPAIAADGTIYIGASNGTLFAVSRRGAQTWKALAGLGGSIVRSPAIGADGTIYIGGQPDFYAVDPLGQQKWRFTSPPSAPGTSSAAIGPDGTIYFGCQDRNLYALNPIGTVKWTFATGSNIVASSPTIGADGTIYVGSLDHTLYAVNPDGTQKWKFAIGSQVRGSSPAIGAEGTIYVGSDDGNLFALNADGTQKWRFRTGGSVDSSPAIGPDGTVYFGSDDRHVYALGAGVVGGGACCGAQQFVMQTVGSDSILKIDTLPSIPFPAGVSITVDSDTAGLGCLHGADVPKDGFKVPLFCAPELRATVQITARGCDSGTAQGAGVLWDAAAAAPDPNVTRVADTSDAAGSGCAPRTASCDTTPEGAGADTRGNINTARGGSPLAGGKLHSRLDIPVNIRLWNAADDSCPDANGVFEPASDKLITVFDFMMSLTTSTTSTEFTDLNGDGCEFAGSGPERTQRCSDDSSLPCSASSECDHCSVTTTQRCTKGGPAGCPGTESCVAGNCIDGPLSGVPTAGPCCTVGQPITLVYTGAAFTSSERFYDVLVAGRMRAAITACNAGPPLASCVLSTDPCKD